MPTFKTGFIRGKLKVERVAVDFQNMKRKTDRAIVRSLFKSAAKVRTITRRRILVRKTRRSRPYRFPFVRERGVFNIRTIRFDVNKAKQTAIVGPVGRNRTGVPNVLEFGGTVTNRNQRREPGTKVYSYYQKPRPFMGPGHDKAKRIYPDLWRNSVGQF